ncbi:MAG TPA: hypothetical protein GXZ28_00550 [Clostridiales bacterium]|jgi:uncharacterized membrane protein YvbJ|nr:hypothetical protein [Clostridiales bacterium]
MVCNTCGRHTQNENANFCEYCGSSYRGDISSTFYIKPEQETKAAIIPEGYEKPISLLHWLGSYGSVLLSVFIPYVGWIISLTLLLVWSFDNKTIQSKKNWARAMLIIMGISFVIMVIVILYITLNSTMLQDIINMNFDMNKYYNILNEIN